MAMKKSFRDENPAMQFIRQQEAVEPAPPESPMPRVQSNRQQGTPPMKLNPLYIETKSRHLNLLIQPSLHDRIKDIARARGASVNNTIHQILQEYVDSQGAK